MKRLPGYHDLQREHRWEDLGPVTSLKNANVLVLGAGDIGGHFATLCRSMGAHVRGIKRQPLVYPIVFEDMDGMDAYLSAWRRPTSSHPLCRAHPRPAAWRTPSSSPR